MRILVVDDDTVFCALAHRKLLGLATHVTEAHDGLSAWTIAEQSDFDLALVDLGLPGMDGLALIEHLRKHPRTCHMPIVVITGRDDREAVESAFGAGAAYFITKPINWSLIDYQIKCVMRVATSEQALRLAHQRMRADSRIKDTVIGRLNHSLRPLAQDLNVLTQEMIQLAKDNAPQTVLLEHALGMLGEAERLEAGLSKMTAFASTVSAGRDLCESRNFLDTLLHGVVEQSQAQAAARSIHFRTDFNVGGLEIICDSSQLGLAISNLTENAIRFAPQHSTVSLSINQLPDYSIYISIDDEGCGIAPHHLVQLLSPLVEVESPGRFDTQLSGMGLVATKHIVEAHGGTLEIRSAPGSGTTAAVHLPAERVRRPDRAAA
jgi:signal transduction histidine kinase